MDTQKDHEAARGRIFPVFFKFTLPNILSIMAISSSGIVDAMFLGRFAGPNAMAAVNIINPIFSIFFGISIMLTIGGGVRAGKYIGEKNSAAASSIFTKTVTAVAIFVTTVSLVCFFFSGYAASLLGANEELLPMASRYLKIISLFFIFNTIGYTLSVFIRIEGRPFLASAGLVSAAVINIILDWILVAVLKTGVTGAAIATGVAGVACFLILVSHFAFKKSNFKISLSSSGWGELAHSAYNGLSEFVSEISIGVIMFSFNRIMIERFGTSGVTAFTAINYLMWGGGMIDYATADALNPIVSVNYGAKKWDRIKKFLRIACAFVTANGIIIFLLLTFLPGQLIGIFIVDKNSEAFEIAVRFASYIRWAFFLNGINQVFSAYFTAIHRPLESALVSGSRGLILPLSFLWILPALMGDTGIFVAVPLAEVLAFCAAVFLYRVNNRARFGIGR